LLQDSFDGHAAILARNARAGDPAAQGRPDPPATATPGRQRPATIAAPAMLRYKTLIGPSLHARRFDRQKVEAAVALRRIDRFTAPAMPGSIRIA
jgi:hypothetical protein